MKPRVVVHFVDSPYGRLKMYIVLGPRGRIRYISSSRHSAYGVRNAMMGY